MNRAVANLAGSNLADHRLAKLLAPQSIALVGASPKVDTVGNGMIRGLRGGGFKGRVYAINPNYREIEGIACYPSLADLPERVDHALLGVANARLEAALQAAVAAGIPAATILASGYLEGDGTPPLTRRIAALARGAGMQVCGGNGMGFYNNEAGVRLCGFPPPDWVGTGPIALISHSGSAFSALVHNDRRFGYCLAVSAGQELVTNAADYLDYALAMPSTRVVGLFLEAIRDPAGLRGRARARQPPRHSRGRHQGRAHAGKCGAGPLPQRRAGGRRRCPAGNVPPPRRGRGRGSRRVRQCLAALRPAAAARPRRARQHA